MNDDDFLPPLRNVDLAEPPSLEVVRSRARVLHRQRTARRRAAVTGVVAAVLVVGGLAAPRIGDSRLGVEPASAGATCPPTTDIGPDHGGPSEGILSQDEWPEHPAALAALRLAPGLRPLSAGLFDEGPCFRSSLPTAVLWDRAGRAGIGIWSDAPDVLSGDPKARSVLVGGRPGLERDPDAGTNHMVTWTTADGTRRFARGDGMTADELVGLLGSLRFDRASVVSASIPTKYRSYPVPPATQEPTTYRWEVEYGAGSPVGPVRLTIEVGPVAPIELDAAQHADDVFTSVDGTVAVWVPYADGGSRLYWHRDGAGFGLYRPGNASRADMVQLAESLTTATNDDARFAGVPSF